MNDFEQRQWDQIFRALMTEIANVPTREAIARQRVGIIGLENIVKQIARLSKIDEAKIQEMSVGDFIGVLKTNADVAEQRLEAIMAQ